MNTKLNNRYRPEIDGLRAIAVLAVLIYHARFNLMSVKLLPGGFLGVDIFFVISGYLISLIIFKEKEKGTFLFSRFYERRAKRILPALFSVIFLSFPFSLYFMFPDALIEFGNSVISTLFFSSNIFFWLQDSYVAQPSELKPLLHTWSLAIEEQFYFIFPLIFLFVWKYLRKMMLLVIVTLILVSFLFAVYKTESDPDFSFYLIFSRCWELGVGSLLAYLKFIGKRITSDCYLNFYSILGLILILFGFLFGDINHNHPGLFTIIPIIGVALIIWFAEEKGVIKDLLSKSIFVSVGKISYSLYLTHFPIFAFFKIYNNGILSNTQKITALFLSLILAITIYNIIEKPFRFKTSRRTFYSCLIISALVLIFSSIYITVKNGLPNRFSNGGNEFNQNLIPKIEEQIKERNEAIRATSCYMNTYGPKFDVFIENFTRCSEILKDKQNIVVIGDSHGADMWLALTKAYPENNFIQITGAACGYNQLEPGYPIKANGRCSKLWKFAWQYVEDNKENLDGIIITSRVDLWVKLDIKGLASIRKETGVPIAVFGPQLQFNQKPHEFLIKYDKFYRDPNKVLNTELGYKYVSSAIDSVKKRLALAKINYIDTASLMCPNYYCMFFVEDGKAIFYDEGHTTVKGAEYFADKLREKYFNINHLLNIH